MSDKACVEEYFLPLSRRAASHALFVRVIGYDEAGILLRFLQKYYRLTARQGVYLRNGLANPAEQEIERFYASVGERFLITEQVINRHMTMWLGQLRPAQRILLSHAVMQCLQMLQTQGANENILKNAYIKFMCWFRSALAHVLTGLGGETPPKVLFEGDISKYELYVLHLLHMAGCDVVYVSFTGEQAYQKIDAASRFSAAVYGERMTAPAVHFSVFAEQAAARPGVSARPHPAPERPATAEAAWKAIAGEVVINAWAGKDVKPDAALQPCAARADGKGTRLRCLFLACFGIDERAAYRNRLFHLYQALDASPKTLALCDCKPANPTAQEAERFRQVDKNASRDAVRAALAAQITLESGQVQTLLAQKAFFDAMAHSQATDPVRFYNYGVRLACWVQRFGQQLFQGYRGEHVPALLYYGPVTAPELDLLWTLAQTGVDVLYFCPAQEAKSVFDGSSLPAVWCVQQLENSAPVEPFPQREERLRVSTTAYNASRELDKLLYTDTGMFRSRQFARSSPVTLKTTYDEIGLLWKEQAQYRPSFSAKDGVVAVPNLFVKICGAENGDARQYWDQVRSMLTENTYLVTAVPFLNPAETALSAAQAASFLHDGRLDPVAIKASRFYRYEYLPEDTQDYILEKIQALMDYDLLVDSGPGLSACMLSVLLQLDKELLRLLQNFDFPREIPKLVVVDVTEQMFTREECILLAFCNLVGFDIAVFTPTGYRNLEKYLRADSFETHNAGEFLFDLTIPNLRDRKKTGDWLGRLFGAGKP